MVIFDLSRFSIAFLLLPNQVDLSAHCSYHFSASNMRRLRCNNTFIFLWRFSDKISSLARLMKTQLSKVAFLNDQNTFLVVKCLRLPFRSVGSGWQWIPEGLNCVRFLFKIVTYKIGPLSHLNDFHLFLVTISVNFYFMHNPVFEHSNIHFQLIYWLASFSI